MDLQLDAARDGPIIVLIASKCSCDAIIIDHPAPTPSGSRATRTLYQYGKVCVVGHHTPADSQPRHSSRDPQPKLIKVLRELWDDVVCPVVESLDKLATSANHHHHHTGQAKLPNMVVPNLIFQFLAIACCWRVQATLKKSFATLCLFIHSFAYCAHQGSQKS